MPTHCSAFGCSNSSGKEACRRKGISFHKFPLADKIVLGRWLINIRRANFRPTSYSYLCSNHFTEEDFEYQPFTNRRGLKKGAIPTKFSYKSGHKRKRCVSYKNRNHELYGDNSSEPVLIHSDMESNEVTPSPIQMDNPALVEIFMNEKFYPPEHLEALANGLPQSFKSKRSRNHSIEGKMIALKESLHAKILLRSLKKQLLDAEIKAANAKRDYYEAKIAMLSKIQDMDSEDNSDSETDRPFQNIKTRLEEEELAAQIEERMLKEQLKEAQMHAINYEKDYYETKSSMLSFS